MSLISAITARGHMRFMIKEKGGVNAAVFIEFLKRLMAGAKRAIFLIVDRGPATLPRRPELLSTANTADCGCFFCRPIRPPQSRRTGLETPQGRHCWPHDNYRQGRFQSQGPRIYAPTAKRPRKNPVILPKTIAQICRLRVHLLMGLINIPKLSSGIKLPRLGEIRRCERIRRKCASRASRLHPPTSIVGPVRENPYDRVLRLEPTGRPRYRAGSLDRSIAQTPSLGIARRSKAFASEFAP